MKHLKEAIEHCYEVAKDQCGNRCGNEHIQLAKWLEDLQDFYTLREQGKLLILPCKPGDTVYLLVIDGINSPYIKPWKVKNIEFCVRIIPKIGKTVFLTKQEADEALGGMEE